MTTIGGETSATLSEWATAESQHNVTGLSGLPLGFVGEKKGNMGRQEKEKWGDRCFEKVLQAQNILDQQRSE